MTFQSLKTPCEAFRIHQIIFDHSDLVSIDCTARIQQEVKTCTLLFTFSVFNDFLRLSGQSGAYLQQIVCDKLLGKEEPPYILSFDESPLLFTNCELEVSYLLPQDTSCFSVEKVKPISFLVQAQYLKRNIRDFGMAHLAGQGLLRNAMQDLASVYRYYRGLLELNVNEHAAREKSGLLNEKIFKMAYYAADSMPVME